MTIRSMLAATAFAAVLVGFAPASHAQSGPPKFFFESDMVRGQLCVLNNQFKRKETVVFRVRVLSPKGENLSDKGLKTLTLELSNGTKVPMHYGSHPRNQNTDNFWTVSWAIPENFPTGELSYKVTAVGENGDTQTWSPFNVKPSQLTVVE